jgi:superfamily II DNA or RNA helicase
MQRRFFRKNGAKTATAAAPPPAVALSPEYKELILANSYLSPKGFTIPKSVLLPNDLITLKKELSLKKIQQGGAPCAAAQDEIVYAYRENEKKIYIPRYYAASRYGAAKNSKISVGEPMNAAITFGGQMRDYQTEVVEAYKGAVAAGGGGLISLHCGAGKTVIAIKIATELRKKTLIIVHKEFLMNQWIERIRDFCGAETPIGRIQGEKFDVEGKDFVVGMLQTLYSRDYPEEFFAPFGLLIVDETHRICSEQFSRALFKFSPQYTMGISATLERKDGLDILLNMFIGDVVYHKEREKDDQVCVRAIEYVSHGDPEFEKTECDFRGNVQFSTMISKLCEYVPRAEFVIRVIRDLITENPEQQIMVLAHNRNILFYLHDAIRDREIAPVGYYLGGMKERDLKDTEDKQIVIATYAMAAEALDIKTLSTLVMVTPKKDITQSVGRILRMKHENPIVVDIVDTHDVFQNQWKVRRAYYKKCNYRIRYIKSPEYATMTLNWDTDNTWKRVYEPVGAGGAATPQTPIVRGKFMGKFPVVNKIIDIVPPYDINEI